MAERALLGGRYELGAAIGAGGFATVFRARDLARERGAGSEHDLDHHVAVKLVPPGFDAERLAKRLRVEASVLTRLRSRHLARVHDFGSDEHGVWLVTELVDGVPLSAEGLGRPLLPHEVLRVARGLLEGLGVAHAAGIVHGDVKPANVLVPRTESALDGPKLIDFGAARVVPAAELAGQAAAGAVVLGTARWMAPEVLAGREADFRSDVYSAGLVLFELLGAGELFPGSDRQERLRARLALEPALAGRVVEPLASVLQRMLAREPAARFLDANEALAAIVDLDTAPVSLVPSGPPSSRSLVPSLAPSGPPSSRSLVAAQPSSLAPRMVSGHPSSVPSSRLARREAAPPRLSALSDDAAIALRETLGHLDMPMLDALARRERGQALGRLARAVALALRLELDAAALIVEPLLATSDVARAVGACLLGPLARRSTRARIDVDRDDGWLDTVPAELGALLAALGAALSDPAEAARNARRCTRALARLERREGRDAHVTDTGDARDARDAHDAREKRDADDDPELPRRLEALRVTLRFAEAASQVRTGELAPGAALDLVAPLDAGDGRARTAFDRLTRPLLAAAIAVRLDEGRARDELERATRAALDQGVPLLEAFASGAWGRLLVDAPHRAAQALGVLDRAATLLAHGDAPGLLHEAEHHRGAAHVVRGQWKEAIPRLRAAREAARAEGNLEAEVLSASLEVVAHLVLGDRDPARDASAALGSARIGAARGRAGAFAWIARCLEALAAGEAEGAEDALAEATARARDGAGDHLDAHVLVEVLAMLFDAAKGALPDVAATVAELERLAADRGFLASYWLEALRSVLERVDDAVIRTPMLEVLARVTMLLGPGSRMARDRRTSAPPGMLP
ncbi:MAG: Serine/threonine protein kinase PrkC, regulator of stationary phase [Labilithrix sp.]|nr:Serine/threonine protein kinase PrkC, regulator of stationary phase [Labilithrix sp.]